jgi:hypothetical protein
MALTKVSFNMIKGQLIAAQDFGAIGDGAADDAAAIQDAIDYAASLGGGQVLFEAKDYRINSTITLPGNVFLVGKGGGRVLQPVALAPTQIVWGGGAQPMVKIGWGIATVAGGGIEGMRLNGTAVATECVSIKDHQHGFFNGLVLTGATNHGLYFTNTPGYDPTGFSLFEDLQISLRGGPTNNANGITFDGVGSGVDGVTLCTFIRARVEHANGAGVFIGFRGDGMMWIQPQIFRADVETGIGVWATSLDPDQVIGGHVYEGPIISSGIRIDYANAAVGWTVNLADDVNVNTGIDLPVYGPGAGDVSVASSYSGRVLGPNRTIGWRNTVQFDAMAFMRWDSVNSLLHTKDGNWRTSAGGSNITDAALPGGAVQLDTASTIDAECWVRNTNTFSSGISALTNLPYLNMTFAPITLGNIVARFGMLGDFNASPTDGMFIQFDPSVSPNYIATCAANGVITSVDTNIGASATKIQWRIEVSSISVNFFYRTDQNKLWALATEIKTNIPSAVVSSAYYVKTKANAAASIHVYDTKFSYFTE